LRRFIGVRQAKDSRTDNGYVCLMFHFRTAVMSKDSIAAAMLDGERYGFCDLTMDSMGP
jgi:hypothetical protein